MSFSSTIYTSGTGPGQPHQSANLTLTDPPSRDGADSSWRAWPRHRVRAHPSHRATRSGAWRPWVRVRYDARALVRG